MNSAIDDDSVPDEIHRRIVGFVRFGIADRLGLDDRADLIRALDGHGFMLGKWQLEGPNPALTIEVLTELAELRWYEIPIRALGLTVDGDGLSFTPVD